MNIFQSFQPNRQKVSIENVAKQTKTAGPIKPTTSSLKTLLLNLDNDPLTLTVSTASVNDANAKSKSAKLAHVPLKGTEVVPLENIHTDNLVLYKHVSIEANFDITSLINETQSIPTVQCFTYPYNRRLTENYSLSDFVNRNLNKARHWAMQESDLPYLNVNTLGNTTTATSGGTSLMLGGQGSGAASSGLSSGPPEHEAALLAVQSRMLKWQDALHSLLRGLYAYDGKLSRKESNGSARIESFYLLGRSLLLPAAAANSAATNNGTMISLPYTSAVFYHVHKVEGKPIKEGSHTEPACLLIGVHKSTLARLHQLGAQCSLVEDLAHPWTAPGSALPTSASGEINVTTSRGTIDPHASTSALLNNKKIGINLLLTGQFSVSVAAEVLAESVFAFVQEAGRPSTFDVPILMAHHRFPHAVQTEWDRRAVQCEHKFSTPGVQNTSEKEAASASAFHKIHFQGILTSAALPTLLEDLRRLSKANTSRSTDSARADSRKQAISSAYQYLRQKEGAVSRHSLKSGDLRNQPNALPVQPLTSLNAPPPPVPVVNPMVLVTTASRRYVAESSESEGEEESGEAAGKEGAAGNSTDKTAAAVASILQTSLTKRKFEDRASSGIHRQLDAAAKSPLGGVGLAPSDLRTEEWLKARRLEAAPYFLLQLSALTPRCVQLTYAHSTARSCDPANPSNDSGEFALQPLPLIDEIRWCDRRLEANAEYHDIHSSASSRQGRDHVELLTTTQPVLRARAQQPPKVKLTHQSHNSDHIDELEENGVLLDALNKYSVYVTNKPM